MALLARLAAAGLRSAATTAEGASGLSLLARSNSQALLQLHTGGATASAAAAGTNPQSTSTTQQQSSTPCKAHQRHSHPHEQQQQQQLRWGLFPSPSSSSSSSSSSVGGWRGISSSAAANSQCDCPTLGGPTPDIVNVEYDEDEVDRFIALADAIEEAYPNVVVEGNPSGPGRPGAFEVTLPDGAVLYSKLSSGSWPAAKLVVDAIGSSAACGLPQQQQQQ